jgi:hypothetical protein
MTASPHACPHREGEQIGVVIDPDRRDPLSYDLPVVGLVARTLSPTRTLLIGTLRRSASTTRVPALRLSDHSALVMELDWPHALDELETAESRSGRASVVVLSHAQAPGDACHDRDAVPGQQSAGNRHRAPSQPLPPRRVEQNLSQPGSRLFTNSSSLFRNASCCAANDCTSESSDSRARSKAIQVDPASRAAAAAAKRRTNGSGSSSLTKTSCRCPGSSLDSSNQETSVDTRSAVRWGMLAAS